MYTSMEIFAVLNDYLERRITLWDLESWLIPRLPLYLQNPDSTAARLAGTIELCLSELQGGIRTERGIKKLLSQQATPEPIYLRPYPSYSSVDEATSSTPVMEPASFGWFDPSQVWSTGLRVANV